MLWCETPPAAEFGAHPLLAEFGFSPDVPLCDRLDGATYERLERAARTVGIDMSGLQGVRPWIAAQIVRHATYGKLYEGPPMDDVLRDIAIAGGKDVHTEFSAEGIIRAFGELPPDVEAEALNFDLDEIEAGAERMVERYERAVGGDLTLEEQDAARVASTYPGFFARLVRERNVAWGPRIDAALSSGTPTFFAIGTLHLVGPENVLTFLRDDVRRID